MSTSFRTHTQPCTDSTHAIRSTSVWHNDVIRTVGSCFYSLQLNSFSLAPSLSTNHMNTFTFSFFSIHTVNANTNGKSWTFSKFIHGLSFELNTEKRRTNISKRKVQLRNEILMICSGLEYRFPLIFHISWARSRCGKIITKGIQWPGKYGSSEWINDDGNLLEHFWKI